MDEIQNEIGYKSVQEYMHFNQSDSRPMLRRNLFGGAARSATLTNCMNKIQSEEINKSTKWTNK